MGGNEIKVGFRGKEKEEQSAVDKVYTSTGSLRVYHSAFTYFSFFIYCSPSQCV
jgi:hypothetical protein